jgi:hypothetical protein
MELRAKQTAMQEKELQTSMSSAFHEIDESIRRELGLQPVKSKPSVKQTGARTLASKSAANALGKPRIALSNRTDSLVKKQVGQSAAQRQLESLVVRKGRAVESPPRVPSMSAAAASRSTLGYAKGRAVSSKSAMSPLSRTPVSSVFRDPKKTKVNAEDENFDKAVRNVVDGLRRQRLFDDDIGGLEQEEDSELGGGGLAMDDEWDGFELAL